MSSSFCRLHKNLPIFNLRKYPGTCEGPALMKRYLFRGEHELLRKKKPVHHTSRHTLQLFNLKTGTIAETVNPISKIEDFVLFFFLPSVWENAYTANAIWLIDLHVVHWLVYIHFWIFVLLTVLVSGLQIEKLRHGGVRQVRFHLQWRHKPQETCLKSEPALCSLSPL